MTYLVVLAFLAILVSLGVALLFMLRGGRAHTPNNSKRMAWALAVRVGLSITLFLCVLLSWKMGWLQPHGIPLGK